jgi:hypothetical protein
MRSVVELYDRFPGSDIYILGTGTSVRVFPMSVLEGRLTIGLNMAWKLWPVQFCITQRPELNVPEFRGEGERPEIHWVIKPDKLTSLEQERYVRQHEHRFFAYRTDGKKCDLPKDQPSQAGRMPQWVRQASGPYLYLWSSISQAAMNLAANMGAKNIFLVGCDNCSLDGNHHAHRQHTFWKGEDPDVRYKQYEDGCAEVRAALRERGVNVVSLTPFVGLRDVATDFRRLCEELSRPAYVHNEDISPQQAGARRADAAGPWWHKARRRIARRIARFVG